MGASKAGTTSLFRILDSSDAIYMPERKELNFFSVAASSKTIDEISLDGYKTHFEEAPAGTLKGAASPSYLWFTGVAKAEAGDRLGAAKNWQALLARIPADTPQYQDIQRRIDDLLKPAKE